MTDDALLEAVGATRRGSGVVDRGGPWQLQLSVTDDGDAVFEGDILLGKIDELAAPMQRLRAALAALDIEAISKLAISDTVRKALREAKAGLCRPACSRACTGPTMDSGGRAPASRIASPRDAPRV